MNRDSGGTEYNSLQTEVVYNRLKSWITTTKDKVIAQKAFRVYVKCLLKNKIKIAVMISEKYKKQIESVEEEEKEFIFKYYYHYFNGLLK